MALIGSQITQNVVRGYMLLAVLSRYIELLITATSANLLRLS